MSSSEDENVELTIQEEGEVPKEDDSRQSLSKDEKSKEFWKQRRKAVKMNKKLKKKEKPNWKEGLTEDEIKEKKELMRLKDSWKILPLEQIKFYHPRVVIDLRFCDQLRNKEQRSVKTQLGFTYGFLRQTRMPLELHLTSFDGPLASMLHELQGFSNWKVYKHAETCDTIFDKTTLVYLSPDATTDLLELDEEKTYIIGGIVDHNRMLVCTRIRIF